MRLVLLPGMHGTAHLFEPLIRALPENLEPEVVTYPTDEPLGYGELLARIQWPTEPFVLLAESFSGPLAIRLAAQRPPHLKALILVATFAHTPRVIPRFLTANPALTQIPIPNAVIRFALLGKLGSNRQLDELKKALRSVKPAVLSKRLREISCCDVRAHVSQISVPTLYIQATGDRLINANSALEMKTLKPEMQMIRIEGPHLILQTQPELASLAVNEFVQLVCR
jgi:pimeloyl-[acyl-carrier protein] methyl ester esterase